MYKRDDLVVKLRDRVGEGARFVEPGTRGKIIRIDVPAAADADDFPYILVQFAGTTTGVAEWVYYDEIVRADAFDMFVKENGREPKFEDVMGRSGNVLLLSIYPQAGEIIGDGPMPEFEMRNDDYTGSEDHAADIVGYPEAVMSTYASTIGAKLEPIGVSYDPPGGQPGDTPQRVLMPEGNGSFTWVIYIDDSTLRKMQPVGTVVTEYFPDGLLGVSAVAWVGNEKHNPGERLHWARDKSFDQIDAEFRHAIDAARPGADGWDTISLPDGRVFQVRHKAAKAWRALADAQLDIERANGQVIRRLK